MKVLSHCYEKKKKKKQIRKLHEKGKAEVFKSIMHVFNS